MGEPQDQRPDDELSGQVDSDDTTQADAGMVGGTGAEAGEATTTPLGTEPHADDEEDTTSG